MQPRRINIGIEPSLDQLRLPHSIPAFVAHINLDRRMSRQLKLFLNLPSRWCGRDSDWFQLHGFARCPELAAEPHLLGSASASQIPRSAVWCPCGHGYRAVKRARAIHINIFEPVGSSWNSRRGIDPGVTLARMLRQRSAHHQSRARNQRRIHAHPVPVLFAVHVEPQIVRLASGLPRQHHATGAILIRAGMRRERTQGNPCRSCDDLALRRRIVRRVRVRLVGRQPLQYLRQFPAALASSQ